MSLDCDAVKGAGKLILIADGALGPGEGPMAIEGLLDHVPQGGGRRAIRGWEHYLHGSYLSQGSWGRAHLSGLRGAEASARHGVYLWATLVDKIVTDPDQGVDLTKKPQLRRWLADRPLLSSLR